VKGCTPICAVGIVPQLLRGHLQHHGVKGKPHGRHRDTVLVGEIGDRLDAGIDAVKRHRSVRHCPDRFDLVGRATGLLPDGEERRQRYGAVVGGARQDGVENGAGPAQGRRGRLDLSEPELARLFLQDTAAHHKIDREIKQPALLNEGDLEGRLCSNDRRRGKKACAAGDCAQGLPPA